MRTLFFQWLECSPFSIDGPPEDKEDWRQKCFCSIVRSLYANCVHNMRSKPKSNKIAYFALVCYRSLNSWIIFVDGEPQWRNLLLARYRTGYKNARVCGNGLLYAPYTYRNYYTARRSNSVYAKWSALFTVYGKIHTMDYRMMIFISKFIPSFGSIPI